MALVTDLKVGALVGTVAVAAVAFGFSRPALTEATPSDGVSPSENLEQTVLTEADFCEDNLSDVNCACFASKSAQVMAHDAQEYLFAARADKTTLARGQARAAC